MCLLVYELADDIGLTIVLPFYCPYAHMHTHARIHMQSHTHKHTHINKHTHTHACMHAQKSGSPLRLHMVGVNLMTGSHYDQYEGRPQLMAAAPECNCNHRDCTLPSHSTAHTLPLTPPPPTLMSSPPTSSLRTSMRTPPTLTITLALSLTLKLYLYLIRTLLQYVPDQIVY